LDFTHQSETDALKAAVEGLLERVSALEANVFGPSGGRGEE
jgi:hypothetical protein